MISSNTAPQVLLVHPPWRLPSGGHRYNFALLAQARRDRFPLLGWVLSDRKLPSAKLIFWDSLFMPYLAERSLPQGSVHALLLHYLPSLDPGLSPARRQALQAIESRALAHVDWVVATGAGLVEPARRLRPEAKVVVCEPGVDGRFLASLPRPAFVSDRTELVTVANLLPAKGYSELLQVLAGLRRYRWRWHWVGSAGFDPGHALRLQGKIRRLGLAGRVIQHGTLPPERVIRLLDAADWFLFPSRFESFGMALAEAAARRVPILSTRVGEASRWVRPGCSGWLVEPGDRFGFAQAFRKMFETPKPRWIWRKGYRELPTPLSWEAVFRRWRAICLALMGEASDPRIAPADRNAIPNR
ncbi:glycosyltransferase family 4 protein [Methylohalobius crimeensis]|uniref:glycosyltransferase family 4 protein n=1 Tax=Methylohalobius crimeensis TaxID=244365 RepID=UPI0003B68EC7|nr:glycosyltransferase [Methylohalobius crimeensis]